MPIKEMLTSDIRWKKFCDSLAGNLKTVSNPEQRMRLLLALNKINEVEHTVFETRTPKSESDWTFHAH